MYTTTKQEITYIRLASFPGSVPHEKEPGNETNTQQHVLWFTVTYESNTYYQIWKGV